MLMKHVLGFATKLHGHTLTAPRRLSKVALDIEQAVWFREGQIVKFFMPHTNKERQIDQGVVVKVDLRDRMLHIQAAKMGLQHVKMDNPHMEVLNPDEL